MKIAFAASAILLFAGCSTSPISPMSAPQIPAERIYQPEIVGAAVSQQDGTVIFLRDSGLLGSGCSHDIYVDNSKAFAIRHGEQVTIHLPAGDHVFRLETGGGACPNIAMSQETVLKAQSSETFRDLTAAGGQLQLTRIQ